MCAGSDFLADITAFLKIQCAKPIQPSLKHQGTFRQQINWSLRHCGRNPQPMPVFYRCRCDINTGILRKCVLRGNHPPAQIRMPGVTSGTCRGRINAPDDPDRKLCFACQLDRPSQPVAPQSGEKFICPSGITFNQKPVFCPANHKIDKDPALRGQQGTSACLVLGQRLDICRYQRLQEICGLCAADAKYLSRIVTRKATGQRCRIIAHGSVISPS